MIKENQILKYAVESLRKLNQHLTVEIQLESNATCDGIVVIAGLPFSVEIKRSVKTSYTPRIIDQCKQNNNNLLVAECIGKTAMDRLVERDINVLDIHGNCIINIPNRLYIHNIGNKMILQEKEKDMNFKISGLKVVFCFLNLEGGQIPSIRSLASMSGASVGTVKHVIDVLESNDYIFNSGKNKFIKDRGRLLEEWTVLYNRTQRSAMQVGRASWVKSDKDWQNVALPKGMIWGGDPGAFLLTGYMTPAEFCIYTEQPVKEILKTKALVPNKEGEVILYQKFWEGELTKLGKSVLCYADLISQNNSRCMEAAKIIRDEMLTYTE